MGAPIFKITRPDADGEKRTALSGSDDMDWAQFLQRILEHRGDRCSFFRAFRVRIRLGDMEHRDRTLRIRSLNARSHRLRDTLMIA
jgi:hypothetical protein